MSEGYDAFYQSRQERLPRFPDPYGSYVSYRLIHLIFKEINKLKSSELKLLDAGCGSGQFPLWILNHYPKHKIKSISAIEEAKWPVEYANRYMAKIGEKKITYHHSRLENFKSPTKFDFIYTVEVVEHVDDRKRFLNKLYDLLEDGGRLFITTPNDSSYLKHLKALKKWISKKEEYTGLGNSVDIEEDHKFLYTSKALRKELEDAGFTNIHIQRNSIVFPGGWCDKVGFPLHILEHITPNHSYFSWGLIATATK